VAVESVADEALLLQRSEANVSFEAGKPSLSVLSGGLEAGEVLLYGGCESSLGENCKYRAAGSAYGGSALFV
jgi:hypothetical protein